MRDPWFPIVALLVVVLTAILGIVGPVPPVITSWVMAWQGIIGAGIASIAAFIAFKNTTKTLRQSAEQETHRRSRKLKAVRTSLPLAIAQISEYAEESARALNRLIEKCDHHEALPLGSAPDDLTLELPEDTLKTIVEFLEYSDEVQTGVMESTIAAIQVHDSRLRGVLRVNSDPAEEGTVIRHELEGLIVDAAAIYAGAAAHFEYGRRRTENIATELSWSSVTSALGNLRFYDDSYPRLHKIVEMRAKLSRGPFDRNWSTSRLLDQVST